MRPILSHASARVPLVALVALAGITCAIYWPALYGPFLLDDGSNIPQTRLDSFSLSGLVDIALGQRKRLVRPADPRHELRAELPVRGRRPVRLQGGQPRHPLPERCAGLRCSAALALDACARASGTTPAGATLRLAALTAAALWTLHPLQVSTVMYAVQRMALLSTMFSVLALITLPAHAPSTGRGAAGGTASACRDMLLSTLLACLSKENGALILVHVLLIETLLFRFRTSTARPRRFSGVVRRCGSACPFSRPSAYFLLQSDTLLSGYERRGFDLSERLWTQASVMVSYLRMILLPDSVGDDLLPRRSRRGQGA